MDEEAIRRRAHEIWEREGRPEGKEAEHRERARRELAEAGEKPPEGAGDDNKADVNGRTAIRHAAGREDEQGGGA